MVLPRLLWVLAKTITMTVTAVMILKINTTASIPPNTAAGHSVSASLVKGTMKRCMIYDFIYTQYNFAPVEKTMRVLSVVPATLVALTVTV